MKQRPIDQLANIIMIAMAIWGLFYLAYFIFILFVYITGL